MSRYKLKSFTKYSLFTLFALVIYGLVVRFGDPNDSRVVRTVSIPDLPEDLELFDSVFWEPGDTDSLRQVLRTSPMLIAERSVLDIGTGSGLLALCCSQAGAAYVTATDVNPQAVDCARHNAKRLELSIDVRLASATTPSAYAILDPDQKFDLIVSNPPWEDGRPQVWEDYALYDPGFQLLRSIIGEGKSRLHPGGKILLAYGCVAAIRKIEDLAAEYDFDVTRFDDRDLDSLPPVFLPGYLLGLTPRAAGHR